MAGGSRRPITPVLMRRSRQCGTHGAMEVWFICYIHTVFSNFFMFVFVLFVGVMGCGLCLETVPLLRDSSDLGRWSCLHRWN